MTPVARARLITAGKAIVTAVLIGVVLRRTPLAELGARLASIQARDVLLLVALSFGATLLHVVRWSRLLRALGERVPFGVLFGDVCVGNLYNLLLPGGVGGDVVRAVRTGRRLNAAHHAWSTSVYERIAGLFAMTALASVALILGVNDSLGVLPPWLRLATLGLAIVLALGFVFASLPFRAAGRMLGSRMPEAARVHITGIGADLRGPLAALPVRAEAVAWSLTYHAVSLLFVALAASALGAPGHERAIIIGVPIISVLSILPITIGGLGLREGLFVGVLGALGMPAEVGLGIAGAMMISLLLFALLGVAFLLAGPRDLLGPGDRSR